METSETVIMMWTIPAMRAAVWLQYGDADNWDVTWFSVGFIHVCG